MTHLSTHVLDAVTGRPATQVPVTLTDADGATMAEAVTDDDGRIGSLFTGTAAGLHRLRFDTAVYFAARGLAAFYPEVVVAVDLTDPDGRYHVPLLLSPYAYSTYRGS
ncbi:hydroxyisourate hydrolase [Mycolicibacterium sp. S2-37]|uniref:hydroxyisourate hydrolase n=1 Tax=Mycolicibacterium sp. S2-37 TaxID=2810297 RepID=UPI001A94C4C4|nr:hydroxyisourate hydrolase [Mycolicibacterium sp. S2-37]MBO0677721.1 hydroxyisourate hydrolase [Mycolicibacterium sp. S2-37]